MTFRNNLMGLYGLILLGVLGFFGCGGSSSNDSSAKDTYTLSTNIVGEGTISPLSSEYSDQEEVTLTATPTEGWSFQEWQGDADGTDSTTEITMDEDKNVTAVFVEQNQVQYTLSTTTVGEGTISPLSGQYSDQQVLTLTATPAAGWTFEEWQGDTDGTDSTTEITMDEDKDVTAVFVERVLLKTTLGDMIIKLDRDKAPITVENFLNYVKAGFYDGQDGLGATIFHRVVPGFVIQGGGFTQDSVRKTTNDPIEIESDNGLSNLRGTIAMARTSDPNSATSQFYINLVDNTQLDYVDEASPGYAVFGELESGFDVLDAIGAVETTNSIPNEPIVITSATVIEADN